MANKTRTVSITHLPGINYIVVKKDTPSNTFFFSNDVSFAISISGLAALLYQAVEQGFISPKVLEGILEEYNSSGS